VTHFGAPLHPQSSPILECDTIILLLEHDCIWRCFRSGWAHRLEKCHSGRVLALVPPPRTCSAWGLCPWQDSSSSTQHMYVLCCSARDRAEQECGCYTHGLQNATPRPLSWCRWSVSGLLIYEVIPSPLMTVAPPLPPLPHNTHPLNQSCCAFMSSFFSVPPGVLASWCLSVLSLLLILLNSVEDQEFNPSLVLDSTVAKAMVWHFCF
jgi:hypothetical protein